MASKIRGSEIVGKLGVETDVVGGAQVGLVDAGSAGEGGGVDGAGDGAAGVEGAPQVQRQPAEGEHEDEHAEHPHGHGAALLGERDTSAGQAGAAHGSGRLR